MITKTKKIFNEVFTAITKKLLNKENNEAEAKVNEYYLKNILACAPGNLYWKDKKGFWLGCNNYSLQELKLNSVEELKNKTDYDFFTKEQADILRKNELMVMNSGRAVSYEEVVTLPNGKKKTYAAVKMPLKDQEGNIVGIIGNSLDITELKETQAALLEAKEKAEAAIKAKNDFLEKLSKEVIGNSTIYQSAEEYALAVRQHLENIIACMPGNVYWTDRNSIYYGCNDNVLKTFGLRSRDDFIGMTYEDMAKIMGWDEGQGEVFKRTDQAVMNTGQPLLNNEDPPITDAEGKVKYFLTSRVPLYNKEKQVTGMVGISIDITDRKEIEQQLLMAKEKAEAANIAKDMFMENMSHDFKTPMNGIWGVVQLFSDRKSEFPQDIQELIGVQETSVKRLRKLVDSILDFNKIHAGKIQIERDEFNLLDIIESVVYNVSFQIKHKDIDILIDYPADVPRHLLSDSHCVNSIILNLMSNAVKFTEQGYITISVKTLRQHEQKIELQIEVQDTGVGIPPDKFEEIFERFHRLELSNKGLKEGHGIGLSAVKELVDKLNGEISVKSQLTQGSVFTVVLPFEVLDNAYWVSEWKKNHPAVRILLIRDKPTSTDIILSQGGNVTKSDSDGAISCLRQAKDDPKPYEVIIIDDEINLPLLAFVKTIHQAVNAAAMIILSIRPKKDKDKAWYDAAHQAGCFDFIMKPVLPCEMDKKIVQTWQKWKNGFAT